MAAVKGRDTKPELIVRRYLHARGLRYRVNVKSLPGSPDIVLRRFRTVVFVDGCFWHGHEGCRFFKLPASNELFWRHKIATNFARDFANNADLRLAGWRIIRVWECDIKTKERREATLRALYDAITAKQPLAAKPTHDNIIVGYGKVSSAKQELSVEPKLDSQPESPIQWESAAELDLAAEPNIAYGTTASLHSEPIDTHLAANRGSLTIYEPIHTARPRRRRPKASRK